MFKQSLLLWTNILAFVGYLNADILEKWDDSGFSLTPKTVHFLALNFPF